jgi:hypothetical protein
MRVETRQESLQQIWQTLKQIGCETDKGSVHSYIEVYEELLKPYRKTAFSIVEIGLFKGHSLRMWEEYFKDSVVYGIDCSDRPHGGLADLRPIMAEPWHRIYIFDAASKSQVEKTFSPGTKFDVIIEDAGHEVVQQIQLYNIWKEYLAPGGIYIIEDVQDIDKTGDVFIEMGGEIIDRRKVKGRYDDVLVIFRK